MPKQKDKQPSQMGEVDDMLKAILTGNGFPGTSDPYERMCNELLAQIDKASGDPDAKKRVHAFKLEDELRTAIIRMLFGDYDPKDVSADVMRHARENPIHDDFANVNMRKAMSSPMDGIRTFCTECQGNDIVGVRECAAINCPLWSFRMKSNPFFARLVGAEDEGTETDAELAEAEALAQPKETPDAH